ncbi:MAG: hydrogenase maturation nickel metallochaperone HypA [Vulcanimicrobiaceae bacterium]
MHELSVALGLLETIGEAAERDGFERVSAVHVRVGALSGIACDALRFSWELASAETVAAGSELRIEDVPLVIACAACRAESAPNPGAGLRCSRCGLPSTEIVSGRELELVAIEVPT